MIKYKHGENTAPYKQLHDYLCQTCIQTLINDNLAGDEKKIYMYIHNE